MEAARALYLLEVATIRKRYGALGYLTWRLSRYVRLRWRRSQSSEKGGYTSVISVT